MTDMTDAWTPGRGEQRVEWWLKLLARYVVGCGGLVWEMVIRNFADPIAILAFTLLATSVDMFALTRTVLRSAREQADQVREEARAERPDPERELQ